MSTNNYFALIQNISAGFSALKNATYSELQILEIVPNNYSKTFTVSPNVRFNIIILAPNPQNLQLTFFDESGNISFQPFTVTSPLLLKFENENFSKIILNDSSSNQVLLAYSVISFVSAEDAQFAKPTFDLEALPYGTISLAPNQNVIVANSSSNPANVAGSVTVNNTTSSPVNVSGTVTANISSSANNVVVANSSTNPVQISGNTTIQAVASGVVIGSNDTIIQDNVGLSKTADYGQQTLLFDPLNQVGNWVVLNSTGSLSVNTNNDTLTGSALELDVASNPNSVLELGIALGNNIVGHGWDFSGFQKASIQMSINPNVLSNLQYIALRFNTDNSGQLSCPNLSPPTNGSWHVYTFDMSGLSADALAHTIAIYVVLHFSSAVATTGMALFNEFKFYGNVPQILDSSLGIQNSISNQQIPLFTAENNQAGSYLGVISSFNTGTVGNYLKVTITVPPNSFIKIRNVSFGFYDTSLYYYSLGDDITQINNLAQILWSNGTPLPPTSTTIFSYPPVTAMLQNASTSAVNLTTSLSCWLVTFGINRVIFNQTTSNLTVYYVATVQTARSATDNSVRILIDFEGGSSNWFSTTYQNSGGTGSGSGSGGGGGGKLQL